MYTPLIATDSTFSAHSSDALHLSIQSDLEGLCFCVLNLSTSRYVAFKSIPYAQAIADYNDIQPALGRLLNAEPLLNASYCSVSYMYISRHATAIPTAMFDRSLLKSFLEFTGYINELDEVHSYPIPQVDAVAVFAVPSPLAAVLLKKYENVQFYHQCVPMLTFLQRYADEYSPKSLLAVNINRRFADIALYVHGALKMYNTFLLQSPEDLAYFMLAVTQQHGLVDEKTSVLLSGNVEPYAGAIPPSFRALTLDEPHTLMNFAYELSDVANYQFTHLFSLYECA